MMERMTHVRLLVFVGLVAGVALTGFSPAFAQDEARIVKSRTQQGFAIAPVPLNLQGKNRTRVGLGSYLVNAAGGCNDCHTCPSYEPGHNPFPPTNSDGKINAVNYLAGGTPFGPFTSANITPDASGKPAGLDLDEFRQLLRTGHDPDDTDPNSRLSVMPWPVYRNLNDADIHAIYEYLTAIPHAEPGTCTGSGQ